MARTLYSAAAVLLLLCSAAALASARPMLDGDEHLQGRDLLQTRLDCSRVHRGCATCRNQRIKGTRRTEMVCSTCATGWQLRKDGLSKTCDCAAGLSLNGTAAEPTSWCNPCPKGQFCPGGGKDNLESTPFTCSAGLETRFIGAKSAAQCFTKPGFGRIQTRNANGAVSYSAVPCPVGTYNVGGNTAQCQRCGAGLTTNITSASSPSACVAPAGSYLDKGVGKKCPKGTFTTGLNTQAACTPCNTGVTTAAEGSSSAAACDRAIQGYSYNGDGTASECAANFYNDGETTAASCTPCPNGWRTKDTKATGVDTCLAPPGFELKDGATNITECEANTYKADWNRNQCVACGANLVTSETGAVSKDACMVPPGYGIISLQPLAAAACTQNSYGADEERAAVPSARCTPCGPNLLTADMLNSTAAPVGGYTSEAACLTQPGWGMTPTGLPERCPKGTYSSGGSRAPCSPCAGGYTTLDVGATAASACVIVPGWRLNAAINVPEPCDKGSWSAGGDESTPAPTSCTPCSPGFTTQEDEATSADECTVCAAGHGGDGCALCPVNTYNSGGILAGTSCDSCPANTASSNGATDAQQCYADLIDPTRDVFAVSDEAQFATQAGVTTLDDCEAACRASDACITYRFASATGSCQLLSEQAGASGDELSFKVKGGVDYASYKLAAGLTVGSVIKTQASTSLAACQAACTSNGDCEAVLFGAGSCRLVTSELDADYTGKAHVVGARLASYVA